MKEKNKELLLTFFLVFFTLGAFIISQVYKEPIRNYGFLDNILYTPAVITWLYFFSQYALSRFSKITFLIGCIFSILGHSSNIFVSIVNNGGFPVYGYLQEEINLLDLRSYHFIADEQTPVYILGDLKIFDGHSIGDLEIYSGIILIVISLIPFVFKRIFLEDDTY